MLNMDAIEIEISICKYGLIRRDLYVEIGHTKESIRSIDV